MSEVLWGVFVGVLIYWWLRMVFRGGRACCGGGHGGSRTGAPSNSRARGRKVDSAVDPVCGMTLDKEAATRTLDHDGTTFYFCSPGCYDAFRADPEKYLSARQMMH